METPLVTVLCSTYNHAPYIKEALDGFLSQETDFPFEILVHDDASTDGTSEIVLEYAEKYPCIRAIVEPKNLYSQGISYFWEQFVPSLQSKYLARCEGDDYWTDDSKLQKQIEYLEEHEDCVACVHDSIVYDVRRKTRRRLSFLNCDQDISFSDLISSASPYQTSSLVNRTSIYEDYPSFMRSVPGIGDYPLRVYLATCGKVHYFDCAMSVYRRGVPGSWTVRRGNDANRRVEDCMNIIHMLKMADEYSCCRYRSEFKDAILEQEYAILDAQGDWGSLFKPPYRDILLHKRSRKHQLRVIYSFLFSTGKRHILEK